jgi:hypothetical protein
MKTRTTPNLSFVPAASGSNFTHQPKTQRSSADVVASLHQPFASGGDDTSPREKPGCMDAATAHIIRPELN